MMGIEPLPNSLALVGVGVALIASCMSAVGICLQKLAHTRRALRMSHHGLADPDLIFEDPRISRKYYRQNMWISGMALVASASVLDFIALGMAPQIIIAPTGTMTLVFNIVCARYLLDEPVSTMEVTSTAVLVFGTLVAVIAARHNSEIHSIDNLFNLYLSLDFLIYVAVVVCIMAFLGHVIFVEKRLKRAQNPAYRARFFRFSISAMSGVIGSWNVLFAKCIAELLLAMVQQSSASMLSSIWPYLILLGLVTSIFFQFKVLNSALKLFDASYVVPVFQLCWLLGSVLSGLVFFKEYRTLSPWRLAVFALGMSITVVGVALLSLRTAGSQRLLDRDDSEALSDVALPA